jgi:Mg-chelatase subunit ChlI
LLPEVEYSSKNLVDIANLSVALQVDGHRSDLVILKTARAHAAFEGRISITGRDIGLAAELAYPHRLKRGPFQQSEISAEELTDKIEQLTGGAEDTEGEGGDQSDPSSGDPSGDKGDKKKR